MRPCVQEQIARRRAKLRCCTSQCHSRLGGDSVCDSAVRLARKYWQAEIQQQLPTATSLNGGTLWTLKTSCTTGPVPLGTTAVCPLLDDALLCTASRDIGAMLHPTAHKSWLVATARSTPSAVSRLSCTGVVALLGRQPLLVSECWTVMELAPSATWWQVGEGYHNVAHPCAYALFTCVCRGLLCTHVCKMLYSPCQTSVQCLALQSAGLLQSTSLRIY